MTAISVPERRPRRRQFAERNSLVALALFIPPSLIIFVVFFVLPMIDAGSFSFFDWSGYGPMTDFVGLKNYQSVLDHRNFFTSVRNSLLAVAVSLAIQLPLALWCALALVEKGWGVNALRLLFFVPYMLAEVAAGLIWRFVYDGDYGLVPAIGNVIGVDPPFILADKAWAIPAIMVVIVWKYFGFHMMIYIAGLQAIPNEVIEAARLDGVTRGQIIRHIKIPMIWSSIVVSVFFAIVGALQLFDVIIPLTNGGPNNSTHTIVTFLYQFGVRRLQYGFGGAVSVILFVMCVGFTIIYRRALFPREHAS
jgi:raffinose/stachyose/melibiose transport system permease protein